MRWIEEKAKFEPIFLEARTCVYVDSGREPTTLQRFIFDDAEICTTAFAAFLQKLMAWSTDVSANYIVLDPDPVHYFYRHFGKYPVVEIALGDSTKHYLAALNEDPGGSPADAVGANWWECVIIPPSRAWFVHALRSDQANGGHLWIPPKWSDRAFDVYPHIRQTAFPECRG